MIPHTSAPASSAHKPPTARDIPPVTLTNIDTIDAAEFRPYLTQVGALYDALQRAKDNEEDGGTQLLRRGPKFDDFSDLFEAETRLKKPNLSRQASLASLASIIETPTLPRRRSSTPGRKAAQTATPLSTIPTVYFEENFHLENPRTFDVVSERSEVVRPAVGTPDERKGSNGNAVAPRKALATNAILQEKLSWYMDTIEVHLIASISTASTSFFAALGSLKDLHSEAAGSVARIKTLRKELEQLDKEMAVGGLEIVNKKRRRENLKQLSDAVQQLKLIVKEVGNCESMVDKGEVEKALDAIDELEKLIAGETSTIVTKGIRLRDLQGTTSLQGVANDLNTLRFKIGKTFEARFLDELLGDLRQHIASVSTPETLSRWSNASQRSRGHNREPSAFPAYLTVSDDFRPKLLKHLSGLHRARHTSPAAAAFRDSIIREIKKFIQKQMPASNDDDADSMVSVSTIVSSRNTSREERSQIMARNLRAMDPEDGEDLLKRMYIGIGETLRRLGTQVKVLLDLTSTLGDPMSPSSAISPGIRSPSPNTAIIDGRIGGTPARGISGREIQEEMHQTLDMSNLLGQAVDIAQDKIVKVLRVRSAQIQQLSVERFLRYFTLNLLFANECEAVSGRSGMALKTLVNGHIQDYAKQLFKIAPQNLADKMDADPWNAKDFTDGYNDHLTRILSASTKDPEDWTSKVWLPASDTDLPNTSNGTLSVPGIQTNGNSGTSTPTPSSTPSRPMARPAVIEGESFLIPESAVVCLLGISKYLHLATGIPSMTSEIASSLVSYLSVFNSRITQLILGAGATKSQSGLKNITTKHLALAAQALAFISTLIPHIREFVRRHAGSGASTLSLMGEFDKARRSYLEHQQEIYDKFVAIMAGRATVHAKAMQEINWEAEKESVNQYMETLTKETITLHKVLSKHLPEATVMTIMQPVFKAYKEQWGKAYGDVLLVSEDGQKRHALHSIL